jgi:thioredoxin 1
MATVALTEENFQEHVDRPGTLVIDWWAPWCGPCRAFAPIYDGAAERHTEVVFGKVNTEEQPELAGAFGIQSIPTLMVFRDQILLFAQPGMLPAARLEELIAKVQALDMDEVRRQMAEHPDVAEVAGADPGDPADRDDPDDGDDGDEAATEVPARQAVASAEGGSQQPSGDDGGDRRG